MVIIVIIIGSIEVVVGVGAVKGVVRVSLSMVQKFKTVLFSKQAMALYKKKDSLFDFEG